MVDTSSHGEFIELRKGLGREVRAMQKLLSGLKSGAVDQVERFRSKFRHVSDNDLAARKKFLVDTQTAINGKSLVLGIYIFCAFIILLLKQ